MIDFKLNDNLKCEEISLCSTLDDFTSLFGCSGMLMPKSDFSPLSSMVFGNSAIRVWYTEEFVLKGVELYFPEVQLYFRDEKIISSTVREVVLLLKGVTTDIQYECDMSGFNTENGKVRFYSPDYIEYGERARIMSVYIDLEI